MKNETFMKKGTNTTVITAGSVYAIQYTEEANKNNNLPHNQLTLTNRSTEEVYVFLDDMINVEIPDFVLKAGQQMSLSNEEGVPFHMIFLKNVDAANQIELNEIKFRLSTVKEC